MSTTVIATITTILVFFVADILWVKFVTGPFFRARIGEMMLEDPKLGGIGEMMLEDPKLGAAFVFYIIFAIGLVYFAVMPGLAANSLWLTLGNAAFIGLLGYGTFEATNMAILKNWQYSMIAVDLIWGIFGSAGSAAAGYFAAKAFG